MHVLSLRNCLCRNLSLNFLWFNPNNQWCYSNEPILLYEQSVFIEHNEQTHVENLEKDNRTTKSFGDDYMEYLIDDTPRTIEERFISPNADY